MTSATLFLRMLRWRVAVTLWFFLLIGAAAQGPLRPGVALLFAAVSLAASYVVATTVNDIADRDVDRINHPRDPGRPLVTGSASERDLWRTNAIAAPLALATAAIAGGPVLAVSAASLVIGYTYSLRPIQLSYRTWLAPMVLSIAYAIIPYALGLSWQWVDGSIASTPSCAEPSTRSSSRGSASRTSEIEPVTPPTASPRSCSLTARPSPVWSPASRSSRDAPPS
jgi:4-hydroxybenzoate polyprenyltransferase